MSHASAAAAILIEVKTFLFYLCSSSKRLPAVRRIFKLKQ
jgi:hypothetical protein